MLTREPWKLPIVADLGLVAEKLPLLQGFSLAQVHSRRLVMKCLCLGTLDIYCLLRESQRKNTGLMSNVVLKLVLTHPNPISSQ